MNSNVFGKLRYSRTNREFSATADHRGTTVKITFTCEEKSAINTLLPFAERIWKRRATIFKKYREHITNTRSFVAARWCFIQITDLEIPFAGTTISVTRTYDSLQSEVSRDFVLVQDRVQSEDVAGDDELVGTHYEYNAEQPRYLTAIVDSLSIRQTAIDYDEDGRVDSTTNTTGRRTEQQVDVTAREIICNPSQLLAVSQLASSC